MSTCSDIISPNTNCKEVCIEGCMCPEGQVMDENSGNCVEKSQCSCQYNNKTIANGKYVTKDACNTW